MKSENSLRNSEYGPAGNLEPTPGDYRHKARKGPDLLSPPEAPRHSSGWNEQALQAAYVQGPSEELKDELAARDPPDNLEALYELVIHLDNRLQERRAQFVVEVYASDIEVGAALSQRSDPKGELHPGAYFSYQLTAPERNYDPSSASILCDSQHFANQPFSFRVFESQPFSIRDSKSQPFSCTTCATSKWLLSVYEKDIMSCLDHIKASITKVWEHFEIGFVKKDHKEAVWPCPGHCLVVVLCWQRERRGTQQCPDCQRRPWSGLYGVRPDQQAKREQLEEERLPIITNAIVSRQISKYELALYCRRRTCGAETTVRAIKRLLQDLREEKGKDLMGVPLLDTMKMEKIWDIQKRHVKCIQDVAGVSHYTKTGTTTKGGLVLTRGTYWSGLFACSDWTVDPVADETNQLLEKVDHVDDQEDEGFEEDLGEDPALSPLEDLITATARIHIAASFILPISSSTPPAATPTSTPPAAMPSSAPPASTSSSAPLDSISSSAAPASTSSAAPASMSSSGKADHREVPLSQEESRFYSWSGQSEVVCFVVDSFTCPVA
ncbi:hypothetical protein QTP70_015942 [Hemibagrus guttatus]|uniref:Reverse transcriptase/retrotransposon-derived protein RNase H-like domain-containing protein n=1 Tax=Hemibagrus guttatus TaxID=175788 RepID=A0AAE0RB84_9TELE|nr:hypothetical protein QTP70_015942 [Hemibagrus guttatus]